LCPIHTVGFSDGHCPIGACCRKFRPCVGSIGHFPSDFPTYKVGQQEIKFSDNKIRSRQFRPCVACSDAQSATHAQKKFRHGTARSAFSSLVVRGVRDRVVVDRKFRQLCATVCRQNKFEPTSVGKNPSILLSECPNKVRPCVRGIRVVSHCNAAYTRSDFSSTKVRQPVRQTFDGLLADFWRTCGKLSYERTCLHTITQKSDG
ncbi:hypothetical protein AB205_0028820, partial [Aquarana catesbeiana]